MAMTLGGIASGIGLVARPRELRAIIVTTKTGLTIRGLLSEMDRGVIILKAAQRAGEEQGRIVWQAIAGDVVIPADNVDYYQRDVEPALGIMEG